MRRAINRAMLLRSALSIVLAIAAISAPVSAEDGKPPFWASVRVKEINMRVGPGESYRINWVYHRPLLPLKVMRAQENWWLVQDPGGTRGWVLSSLMAKKRGAIVQGEGLAEMHESASIASRLLWRLEPGITGKLGDCDAGWCRFDLDQNRGGWVQQDRLWGAGNL